jgi:hypothetical protein
VYDQCKEDPDVQAETLSQSFARRAALLALLSVALSSIFLAAPLISRDAAAQAASVISVEAEDLYWFGDIGGQPISVSTIDCDSLTSGGKAVEGLDYPGDWIEVLLSVPEPILFRDSLCSAGDVGLRRKFVIEFLPWGSEVGGPAPDTLTTVPGRGIT